MPHIQTNKEFALDISPKIDLYTQVQGQIPRSLLFLPDLAISALFKQVVQVDPQGNMGDWTGVYVGENKKEFKLQVTSFGNMTGK